MVAPQEGFHHSTRKLRCPWITAEIAFPPSQLPAFLADVVGFCHIMKKKASRKPLIKAAKHLDLFALRGAIRSGANLNEADINGWTPLFHAAGRNWADGMIRMIEAGADVNHGSETGFTALFSAVLSGHLKAVQLLLKAGAQVRDVQGAKLTQYAQGKDKSKIISALERATQRNSIKG
jgi:ankyrin repeat protein